MVLVAREHRYAARRRYRRRSNNSSAGTDYARRRGYRFGRKPGVERYSPDFSLGERDFVRYAQQSYSLRFFYGVAWVESQNTRIRHYTQLVRGFRPHATENDRRARLSRIEKRTY